MKAKYLSALLKGKGNRTILELITLIEFWNVCTPQEFKYAVALQEKLNLK